MNRYVWLVAFALTIFTATYAQADKPQLIWKDGRFVKTAPPAEGTPEGELALTRMLLDQKKANKAFKAAKNFLKRYPSDPNIEEVMILAAQAEMDRGNYFNAFERFEEQMNRYPSGPFLQRALQRQYEIADAFLKGRKRKVFGVFKLSGESDGLDILARIAQRVPGTILAEKVTLRVADHYYMQKQYPQAVDSYDEFVKHFPRSAKTGYALLRAAKATHAQYRGDKFDDTPLVDSLQRFQQYAQRYPDQAKKAKINQTIKQLKDALVQRTFARAEFYKRINRPKAAAFYYRQVITQGPETNWARQAKVELDTIGYGQTPEDGTEKK